MNRALSAARHFAETYARTVAMIALGVGGAVTATVVATTIFVWPLLLGVYVEYSLLPWEAITNPPHENAGGDWFWLGVMGLWWLFGLTAIYSGYDAVREVFVDDA